MSAPLVAGQAALIRAAAPHLTPEDVEEQIRETSARPGDEPIARRVDAAASVRAFASAANPIDQTPNYVRQQYLDFLNRAPDAAGLQHWSQGLAACGTDAACVRAHRVNVSAAFFLSIEFQETGYFLYRLNQAAFGDLAGKPVPVRYEEFMPDAQQLSEGVVVGTDGWQQRLRGNRTAFKLDFTRRPRFLAEYPANMSPAAYVDKMASKAGLALTGAERDALLAIFAATPTELARAHVLERLADHPALVARELREAFVLMQYFGYLRRNPDDVGFGGQADPNFLGFNFWLQKLNENNGNYVSAEMVRAFIESIEYRQRFRS
jgi:hypothetical protein